MLATASGRDRKQSRFHRAAPVQGRRERSSNRDVRRTPLDHGESDRGGCPSTTASEFDLTLLFYGEEGALPNSAARPPHRRQTSARSQ